MDDRREAMLKRLADRNEQRILKKKNQQVSTNNIDINATEKEFRAADAAELNMKTPIQKKTSASLATHSPIVSFDEKADQQIVALSTWCNTMIDLDDSEEMDLGSTKMEACRRIQQMLANKNQLVAAEAEKVDDDKKKTRKLFEKNDMDEIRKKCRKLLEESGISGGIREMLIKRCIAVRTEFAIYSDLGLQTSLLRIFLSIQPILLQAALETVFDTKIEAVKSGLIGSLSKFIMNNVFTSQVLLKNRKYAQGSGKPIITTAGKEALHYYFLDKTLQILCLVEMIYIHKLIKNVCRMFTKSSSFKSLDDVFTEINRELLSGSSISLKKACARFGYVPSFKQSFLEDYDYTARTFQDFSNGIILAKLIESIGELPNGSLLGRLRDPSGDRIRKLKNVETVLAEMNKLGILTNGVTPAQIVGANKSAILTVLWSIIGVRVESERQFKDPRKFNLENEEKTNERDEMDYIEKMMLEICQKYGDMLSVEVPTLESIRNGRLLSKAWNVFNPSGMAVQFFPGETIWMKIVNLAECEMNIPHGLDQQLSLFAKMFFERLEYIRSQNIRNSKAEIIQRAWRHYIERKNTPKLYDIVKQLMDMIKSSDDRYSIASVNNATFVVSRDSMFSISDLNGTFKIPKTPGNRQSILNQSERRDSKLLEQIEENMEEMTIDGRTTKVLKHSVVFGQNMIVEEEEEEEVNTCTMDDTLVERICVTKSTTSISVFEKSHVDDEVNKENKENEMNQDDDCVIIDSDEKNETPTPEMEVITVESDEEEAPTTQISSELNQSEVVCFENSSNQAELDKRLKQINEETENQIKSLLSSANDVVQKALENQETIKERVEAALTHSCSSSTPELRKILRAKRALAQNQKRIASQLSTLEKSFVPKIEEDGRLNGGHDSLTKSAFDCAFMDSIQSEIDQENKKEEEKKEEIEEKNKAVITIQRWFRGYQTRKELKQLIMEMQERVKNHNEFLERENAECQPRQATKNKKIESAEKKLEICANMLVNDNLSLINISAVRIDRLTLLVPDLLLSFVTKYDGLRNIMRILEIADRGMAFKAIIGSLFKILYRVFTTIDAPKIEEYVKPLMNRLVSKLFHLMLAYVEDAERFRLLSGSILGMSMYWPQEVKKINWKFYIEKSRLKSKGDRNRLQQLSKIEKILASE